MNRKKFLLNSTASETTLLMNPFQSFSKNYDEVEPYKPELVKEFVIAGHGGREGDLDKVKSMIVDYPNMIYSKYDWGNGDFEGAIEGAGHLGNKEMALFLINAGARVTLFVLCILEKLIL